MKSHSRDESEFVIPYLTLRRAVGTLGLLLPFVLAIGGILIFGIELQPTVSDYYHTSMGDVFVGTLCAIGVFLFSYKGYDQKDDNTGTLGTIGAVGTALFPTHGPGVSNMVGYMHLAFAALFFGTLIYYSLCLFTQSDPSGTTIQKLKRNKVYRATGWTMIACIVAIIAIKAVPSLDSATQSMKPVFWLESLMIILFGIAWITKGDTFWKDR